MHGKKMPRFASGIFKLLSQLHDHLIQRAGRAEVTVTPNLVQQPVTRQDFARMRVEQLQYLQSPWRERLHIFAPPQLKRFWIDGSAADSKSRLFFRRGRR